MQQLMGATGQLATDLIIYAIIAALLLIPKKHLQRLRFGHLVILLIAARLTFYAFKISTGRVLYDFDTTYYFTYGKAFLTHTYPQMEYPTGALLLFSLLSWPAKNVETFRLLFPLLQLPFTLSIVWVIHSFGKRYRHTYPAILGIIIFALSPAANWLWFHRYDDIAISLFLLALFYLPKDTCKGALTSAIGFTIKWVPIFALPAHFILWLKRKDYRRILLAGVMTIAVIAALSLPFWLTDHETFTHTYATQLNRTINGESIYYAIEGGEDIQPYGYPTTPFFTDNIILSLTIIVAAGWLLYLFLRVNERNVTILAALSLVLFIITNKIYSTQYIIWLLPLLIITATLTTQTPKETLLYVLALVALDLCNFIKTPVTPENWILFARLFWALLLVFFSYTLHNVTKEKIMPSPR